MQKVISVTENHLFIELHHTFVRKSFHWRRDLKVSVPSKVEQSDLLKNGSGPLLFGSCANNAYNASLSLIIHTLTVLLNFSLKRRSMISCEYLQVTIYDNEGEHPALFFVSDLDSLLNEIKIYRGKDTVPQLHSYATRNIIPNNNSFQHCKDTEFYAVFEGEPFETRAAVNPPAERPVSGRILGWREFSSNFHFHISLKDLNQYLKIHSALQV